MENQEKPAT